MCERARGGTNTSGLVWMPAGPAGRGTSAGRDGTRSDPVGATCDPGSSPRRHAGARGAWGAWGSEEKRGPWHVARPDTSRGGGAGGADARAAVQ
jgi:hypothetical protein